MSIFNKKTKTEDTTKVKNSKHVVVESTLETDNSGQYDVIVKQEQDVILKDNSDVIVKNSDDVIIKDGSTTTKKSSTSHWLPFESIEQKVLELSGFDLKTETWGDDQEHYLDIQKFLVKNGYKLHESKSGLRIIFEKGKPFVRPWNGWYSINQGYEVADPSKKAVYDYSFQIFSRLNFQDDDPEFRDTFIIFLMSTHKPVLIFYAPIFIENWREVRDWNFGEIINLMYFSDIESFLYKFVEGREKSEWVVQNNIHVITELMKLLKLEFHHILEKELKSTYRILGINDQAELSKLKNTADNLLMDPDANKFFSGSLAGRNTRTVDKLGTYEDTRYTGGAFRG